MKLFSVELKENFKNPVLREKWSISFKWPLTRRKDLSSLRVSTFILDNNWGLGVVYWFIWEGESIVSGARVYVSVLILACQTTVKLYRGTWRRRKRSNWNQTKYLCTSWAEIYGILKVIINNSTKELSLYYKLKTTSSYIWQCKPLIFQTYIIWPNIIIVWNV